MNLQFIIKYFNEKIDFTMKRGRFLFSILLLQLALLLANCSFSKSEQNSQKDKVPLPDNNQPQLVQSEPKVEENPELFIIHPKYWTPS